MVDFDKNDQLTLEESVIIDERIITASEVKLIAHNLIHIIYTDKMRIEKAHIVVFNDIVEEWIENGESACFLVNILGKYNDFSREAQDYLAKDAPILTEGKVKATAIVLNNLAGRILSKFFISVFRPLYPTKIFGSEEDGYTWLMSFDG